MFTGSFADAEAFVALMIQETQMTLTQLPEMRQVDVNLSFVDGMAEIGYIQNWANGSRNAYCENVIRTGGESYEVIGGAKSADRMAAAWTSGGRAGESA